MSFITYYVIYDTLSDYLNINIHQELIDRVDRLWCLYVYYNSEYYDL